MEDIIVNPAQYQFLMLPAKNKYAIFSRGTGKSFIVGMEVDENVRLMPRGVTTITQRTIGQALTKTLPSTFNMLERLGYRPYNHDTKQGDYVVCKVPPPGWYRPYEKIMSYDHCISFSNGHCLYILTQEGNSRGPNADYNITDEALTLNKDKFDQEVAPTNRGNEHIFGKRSRCPIFKHHGNCFTSSMPYTAEQRWLLEPAAYYEEERGVRLFHVWNRLVGMQMQLIEAKISNDAKLFSELWNECARLRKTITPFVSKEGTLFILGSIFDNIANVGMSYIVNQYELMDKLSFMVEILNYKIDSVDHCYYRLDDKHKYYNAYNDGYIRDFAENVSYDWSKLASVNDSRYDGDCDPNQPLEITPDWGSTASFLSIAQEKHYDYVSHSSSDRVVDAVINELFVRRDDEQDTEVNALADKFCAYYAHHGYKTVVLYRDRYGDAKRANSKKSYNELFIDRLNKHGWSIIQKVHAGMEPPQHDKYLLLSMIMNETDARMPLFRINASRCKFTVISMQNTRVVERDGRYQKDKTSERKDTVRPEEATHFGDTIDKRLWTKYGHLLKTNTNFVDGRV